MGRNKKRNGSRRLVAFTAIAALALVAGGASPATAGKNIKSRVEIKSLKTTGAAGVVKSSAAKCEKNRDITLQTWDGFSSTKAGFAKTNSKGKWRVDKNLDSGIRYFAQVTAKGKCAYDTSPFVRLG